MMGKYENEVNRYSTKLQNIWNSLFITAIKKSCNDKAMKTFSHIEKVLDKL